MKSRFVYIFKITLDTDFRSREKDKPCREIAILNAQSLSTLAKIIVTSFDFDFDHCYGFYDNFKNPYKSNEIYELFTDLGEDPTPGAEGVTYTKVSKAFNTVGKKLRFLFDYGDTWLFTAELIEISKVSNTIKYPKVIKRVGKAPEQYPPLDEDYEEEFTGNDTTVDTVLNLSGKRKQIIIASKDKIFADSHQLIKTLFGIEGALITNESILEDFTDMTRNVSVQKGREILCERIAEEYGVVLPEILKGETRVWKVVELIYEKQRESLLFSKRKKERLIS